MDPGPNIPSHIEAIMNETKGEKITHILVTHTHEGVSGVAILAESHISIHTWPERSFAAFDIFMCGNFYFIF